MNSASTSVSYVPPADTATLCIDQVIFVFLLTVNIPCLGSNCVWIQPLPVPTGMCAVRLEAAVVIFV
jgi:hypothetical protein